jgi:DNA-binding CsgD family transcriptional regulator
VHEPNTPTFLTWPDSIASLESSMPPHHAPTDVIGRDALIRRCVRHLSESRSSSLLMLRAEAGIGKTTVLDAVADTLRIDPVPAAALRLAGSETEHAIAYGTLAHLVAATTSTFDRMSERVRSPLLRALGEAPGDVHLLSVCRSVATLLANVGRPVLIDDGHWVDPASRRALVFALRAEPSVRAIVTVRPGEVATELAGGARVVDVPPLAGRDICAVITERVQLAPSLVLACSRLARGNPYAAIEFATACAERPFNIARSDAIPDLDALLTRRIAALPEATHRALGVVALSTGQHLGSVLGRLDLDEGDLAPAETEGLLTDGSFSHPLLRSVTEALLDGHERTRVHLALADQASDEGDADRETWHRSLAGAEPSDVLAERLEDLAQRAWRRGAVHEAREAWERSFAVHPTAKKRRGAVVRAAHKAWLMGDLAGATRLLTIATGPVDAATDAIEELTRGQMELWTDRPLDALHRFERAHAVAVSELKTAAGVPVEALRTYAGELGRSMVASAVLVADDRAATRLAATAVAAWDATWPAMTAIELHTMQTIVTVMSAPDPDTITSVRSALRDVENAFAGAADDVEGPRGTLQILSLIAMLVESPDAPRFAHLAAQHADRAGLDAFASIARVILAELHWRLGRWPEAHLELEPLVTETSPPILRAFAAATLARVVAGAHEPTGDRCLPLAEEAIAAGQAVGLWQAISSGHSAVGLHYLAAGNADSALAALDVAWAVQQRSGFVNPALIWFAADRAEAMLLAGQGRRLEPFLSQLDEMAATFDSTYLRCGVARVRAERDRVGFSGFASALSGFHALDAEFEVARTWLAAARAAGSGSDHDKCLAEARAIFTALGAGRWVATCDERAARQMGAPHVRLTLRETEVVRLIALGQTNDQIARSLCVSVKTVEKVLTTLYRRSKRPNRSAVVAAVSAGTLVLA